MSGKKIHRTRTDNGAFAFTECNIALHVHGGVSSKNWKYVDCKNCLTHKDDAKTLEEIKELDQKYGLFGDLVDGDKELYCGD